MEYDIASIIQGYAQGYFLMADEDGDNLVVFQPQSLIPLDERFHYQSRCGVSSIKSVLPLPSRLQGCGNWVLTGIQLGFHQSYKNLLGTLPDRLGL